MKILNVIQCSNLGGMEQASLRLMDALKDRGHHFQVISLNPLGDLASALSESKIPAVGLRYSKSMKLLTLYQLRRCIAASDADALILTGHNFLAALATFFIAPKRRLFAMHYHHQGVMPIWQWKLYYWIIQRQFQIVTFPSDYVRFEAERISPSLRSISRTVRNPLDLNSQRDEQQPISLRKFLKIPESSPIVGNAGWLIVRKRFDVFLETAAILLRSRPDIHFIIAGDGDQRESLENLVKNLGIEKNVHFIGWLRDLLPFYSAIDVLLFNSDWDCFPTTPAEAMSLEIPVVGSILNGGLSEVLNEQTGWISTSHNVKELASNVLNALSQEGTCRARVGREKITEMSDPVKIAEQVEYGLNNGPK